MLCLAIMSFSLLQSVSVSQFFFVFHDFGTLQENSDVFCRLSFNVNSYIFLLLNYGYRFWDSLVARRIKHLPAMRETQVWSLGWEDPLEKEMAAHSSILAWRIRTDGGARWVTVHAVTKSRTGLRTKHRDG